MKIGTVSGRTGSLPSTLFLRFIHRAREVRERTKGEKRISMGFGMTF